MQLGELTLLGFLIRLPSTGGVAEERPGIYNDVGNVSAEHAGIARRATRL